MFSVGSRFIEVSVTTALMFQYVEGECDMNSVIGDKRMAELAILGEVLVDLSLDELISYNGKFPLWKRVMVAVNTIQVNSVAFCHFCDLSCIQPRSRVGS